MIGLKKHTLGLALMVALPLAFSASTANAQEEKSVPGTCTATLDLGAVPIQAEAVVVRAEFSAPIGSAVAAQVQPESGVQVVKVEPAGAAEAAAATVTLNTSSAVAGEWAIAFQGQDGGTCAGKLQVTEGGAPLH